MLVEPEDLGELDDPSGSRFERVVKLLVREEVLACGLNPKDVDWDYRTNYADGGCDIFVSKGQTQSTASMIPGRPSIWSLKAGANGIDPSKFATELNDPVHTRLRQHLKDGDIYVWCALSPAGQNKRKDMKSKADELAKALSFDSNLIQFVWVDHLCDFLNRHLNLVCECLPKLYGVIKPMVTLQQWADESPDKHDLRVPWISVPGSGETQQRVKTHLLANSGDAVLHLAGLSGIGKTRTVIETCQSDPLLSNTLYIGDFAQIGRELWSRLREPRTFVRLIIDEVPLGQLTNLQDRFEELGNRIRIVSIGPAPRTQARRQSDPMLRQMEPPDTATGVLPVVTSAAPELTQDVRQSIAHFAGHDLRLALLLVRATQRSGQLSTAPLHNYEDVWHRITSLFSSQIRDASRFRELYEILTISVDIGHAGEPRSELQLLAAYFHRSEAELDGAIRDANDCGLGDRLQSFFEARPRALAIWLFQERLWPLLSPRIEEFFQSKLPDRLRRRFLERCQETASPYREEIETRLGGCFLRFLGNPNVTVLSDRGPSRVFQAWAEFDPNRGLAWLEDAVTVASDDDLGQLAGDTDGSGGWRGRRQVVWLCEHLACFGAHFPACERILFRLAQVETEVHIGNNSTNTWREMFLPALANTEVPFPRRLELLTRRLGEATANTLDLILSAFYASIERELSRMLPPSVVGGRIVPEQWKPATLKELEECRLSAVRSVLATIPGLSVDLRKRAATSVVEMLSQFLNYGLVDELRTAITMGLDEEAPTRRLLVRLDEWLAWHERQEASKPPPWLNAVRAWRENLSPASLPDRVKDLTARDYWSVYQVTRRRVAEAEPEEVYGKLAKELLVQPAIVEEMASWLASPEARSSGMLALHLGLQDAESRLLSTILAWFANPLAVNLVANYLRGTRQRAGQLPEQASALLDGAATKRPGEVLHVTLLSDWSDHGLRRVMALLPHLEGDQRAMMRQVSFDPWAALLGIPEKRSLIEQFCDWASEGDSSAAGIAIDIVAMWRGHPPSTLPVELVPHLICLAKMAALPETKVDDHDWKEVVEAIGLVAPQDAAELLAETITDVESHRFHRGRYAQEAFCSLARGHPDVAMQAIGRWILDKRRSVIFRMWEFRGLFDAIGLATVRPWTEAHGEAAAISIARHLDGPRLEGGTPIIPELADWLLTTYSHVPRVFQEFAMGRHSGQFRAGHARDHAGELDTLLKPFDGHPKEWIQKWVQYERDNHRHDIEWDDRRDEERERI
ncbi:MAG: hypothetical protein ABSH20_10995 [Tepidisphaeraceae bacterium]